MPFKKYKQLLAELEPYGAQLVAISKTKPTEDILALYHQGQKIFGENNVVYSKVNQTNTSRQ